MSEQASPRTWHSVAVLAILILTLAVANLFYTTTSVSRNSHQWCATLTLLTSKPVPAPTDPKANPSRQQAYVLYSDFVMLRRNFGCS